MYITKEVIHTTSLILCSYYLYLHESILLQIYDCMFVFLNIVYNFVDERKLNRQPPIKKYCFSYHYNILSNGDLNSK